MAKGKASEPKIVDIKTRGKFNFGFLIAAGITMVIAAVMYYFLLPTLNPQQVSTWIFFGILILIYGFLSVIFAERNNSKLSKFDLTIGGIIAVMLVFVVGASISSSTIFRASDYA